MKYKSFPMFHQLPSLLKKTLSHLRPETVALGIISSLSVATPSFGLSLFAPLANFDTLEPGGFGSSITDGGITFSNLIAGFRATPPEFVVKSSRLFSSVFSPPNYLTFGEPTRLERFGDLGSITITPPAAFQGQAVSIDVLAPNFPMPFDFDQELVLSAFLEGELVASTSVFLSEFSPLGRFRRVVSTNLSISGVVFHELQLFTPTFAADGTIPLAIDNIRLSPLFVDPFPPVPGPPPIILTSVDEPITNFEPAETVPESQPMTLGGMLGVGLLGYLTKKRHSTTR